MSDRTVENFKSQGRPTLGDTEISKLSNALGLEVHKGPGASKSNRIRVKVTTEEWIQLWRLWDKAVDFTAPAKAVDDYNTFAKSLVEKYSVVLSEGETVEFT